MRRLFNPTQVYPGESQTWLGSGVLQQKWHGNKKKRMNRNISTVMPSNAIYKGVITPILFVCHSVETVWFCIFKVCQERLGLDGLRYYREDGSRLFFLSFLRVEVAGEKSMKWVCQKTFFFCFFPSFFTKIEFILEFQKFRNVSKAKVLTIQQHFIAFWYWILYHFKVAWVFGCWTGPILTHLVGFWILRRRAKKRFFNKHGSILTGGKS